MALRSNSFAVGKPDGATDRAKKQLFQRHQGAMQKVLTDAKSFSEDRKRTLDGISDEQLRNSASR